MSGEFEAGVTSKRSNARVVSASKAHSSMNVHQINELFVIWGILGVCRHEAVVVRLPTLDRGPGLGR